jgi:hypothetical protein
MHDAILASCAGAVVRASTPAWIGSEERAISERVERRHTRGGLENNHPARRAVSAIGSPERIVTTGKEVDDAAAAAPSANTNNRLIDEHQVVEPS